MSNDGEVLILYSPTMTVLRRLVVKVLFPLDKAEYMDLNEFKPITGEKWLGQFKKRQSIDAKPMMEYHVLVDVLETSEYNFERLVSLREAIQMIKEAKEMVVDKDGNYEKLYQEAKKSLEEDADRERSSD